MKKEGLKEFLNTTYSGTVLIFKNWTLMCLLPIVIESNNWLDAR